MFPTFEVGQMAAIMPPVGMVETELLVFKRVDGSSFDFENDEVNQNALAKCLMSVEAVPAWLSVHGDYQCDGVVVTSIPEITSIPGVWKEKAVPHCKECLRDYAT